MTVALVSRHRAAQGRIAALTAAEMLQIWPVLVRGGRVEANVAQWLSLALALMARRRAQSAALGAQFATLYRALGGAAPDSFTPTPAVELNLEAARTSLIVLGPTAYRRELARQVGVGPRDLTPQDLVERRVAQGIQAKLAANVARASIRHVQNGARETLDDVIKNDRAVIGYFRSTSAEPCYFCALLASRGPVYVEDSFEDSDPRFTGPGNQKVHDACGCMLLPMYRRAETDEDRAALGRYREYDALWRANPSILAFRQAYEGRTPPD